MDRPLQWAWRWVGEKLKGREGRRVCRPGARRPGAWLCALTPAPQQGPSRLGGEEGRHSQGASGRPPLVCPVLSPLSGLEAVGQTPEDQHGAGSFPGFRREQGSHPEGSVPGRSRSRLSTRPLSVRAQSVAPCTSETWRTGSGQGRAAPQPAQWGNDAASPAMTPRPGSTQSRVCLAGAPHADDGVEVDAPESRDK